MITDVELLPLTYWLGVGIFALIFVYMLVVTPLPAKGQTKTSPSGGVDAAVGPSRARPGAEGRHKPKKQR